MSLLGEEMGEEGGGGLQTPVSLPGQHTELEMQH